TRTRCTCTPPSTTASWPSSQSPRPRTMRQICSAISSATSGGCLDFLRLHARCQSWGDVRWMVSAQCFLLCLRTSCPVVTIHLRRKETGWCNSRGRFYEEQDGPPAVVSFWIGGLAASDNRTPFVFERHTILRSCAREIVTPNTHTDI